MTTYLNQCHETLGIAMYTVLSSVSRVLRNTDMHNYPSPCPMSQPMVDRVHFTEHLRLRSCSCAHALSVIIENTTWHASHLPLSRWSKDDGMFLKRPPTFESIIHSCPSRHLMRQYYTIPCATLCTYPVYAPSEISPFHVLSVRPRVSIRFCHLGPPLSFFLK